MHISLIIFPNLRFKYIFFKKKIPKYNNINESF